jgi:hypothetical protein
LRSAGIDLPERFGHIPRFAANFEVGAVTDKLGEAGAYQGMIVDYQNSCHGLASGVQVSIMK